MIAQELDVGAPRVRRWVARYVKLGLPGTRTMAKQAGASAATISRIWRSHGLKPHLSKTFKVSNDIRFDEELSDIVGLYMNPPARACGGVVLPREEPGASTGAYTAGLATQARARSNHDPRLQAPWNDHAVAALNILDSSVISQCQARHRHIEWLKFLKQIDANVASDLQIHVVLDNYATHKHPKVLKWLAKRPRFHMHFTATSASWMEKVMRAKAKLNAVQTA